jgi:uncharacterized phage-associated protein
MTTVTQSQALLLEIIKRLGGEVKDKTVLAKLQYFSDFIHYAFHDQSISQPDNFYQRRKQGPLSRDFNEDLTALCNAGLLKQNSAHHYSIQGKTDTKLSENELKTVDFVVNRYGNLSYDELVKISHSQIPYLSASGNGAVIEYFTAYNLIDEYPEYAEYKIG